MSNLTHHLNFLEEIIESDIQSKKCTSITTRFPPEPNGYLHIGHAKSICLNFGLAKKYNGATNLRFDDTNPSTEEKEYVESIKTDISWLGFTWDKICYASDYFETLYQFALTLIDKDLAYVDDSTPEEIAKQKGTPTIAGIRNQYANRHRHENKKLFEEMRKGLFPDGSKILRAKIDMSSPNMHLRDPILYRIKHQTHHRTGNTWCIYPMYDFAHGQSDAIEKITHSICTLEFIPHRPLYEWFIEQLHLFPSKQYEFARLNISYTVMSKRKMLQLVQQKWVQGWDDPRMPTISGLRRRGYTPESILLFCEKIGVAKRDNLIDIGLLEFCIREHLNKIAIRRMVILHPLKITITNYDKEIEYIQVQDNPEDEESGSRVIPFSKEIYIEQDDFIVSPPKKYFRLAPGQIVRLKNAYIIKCDEVIKDTQGHIIELKCSYIPDSKSGNDTSGLHPKGTIHWVSISHAYSIAVQLYDRLFIKDNLNEIEDEFTNYINPQSLTVISNAYAEPAIQTDKKNNHFQFIRHGYFCLDKDSTTEKLIFNRTVTLKDTWGKINTEGNM